MRIRLNLCALVAACLCSEVCFSQEFDSPAEPMTAAEIEATFSRLSALKQGLDPSDVFPDAWDSETQTNVSPQGGQSRDIKKVDFIELVVEELALTDQHLSQLLRDGVILRRMQSDFSFPAAYYSIYVRDLPLLVTTDSVLHAVHRSFDEIVDETESTMIQPVLIRMLDRMHSELAKIHDAGDADHLVDSLRDVDLYLTVARNLLEGRYRSRNGTLQPHISDKAAADAIVVDALAANQLDQLAIYGSKRALDYTQFKSLNRIDSFLTEFIGTANGISAMQLLELMSESGIEDINDCADAQKMQRLHARLAEVLGRLKVVRSEIGDTEERAAPVRFQLFSRRFAIDAYLLGQLVFDSIDIDGRQPQRMLPQGLDVMASLGNPLAVDLLRPELERWEYWGNLRAAQEVVQGLDRPYWEQSFYNGWLSSLTHLHRQFDEYERAPLALGSRSWQLKQLQTQLASWAELRRDTVLYVAQTYSPPGCEYPTAYVEPYPEFYGSLRELMRRTAEHHEAFKAEGLGDGFRDFDRAMSRQLQFLQEASELLGSLERIARKELIQDPLTEDETRFLEQTISRHGNALFGSGLLNDIVFDGWYTKLIYGFTSHDHFTGKNQDRFHPVLADVHTSVSDRKVLQVGTGRTDLCVLIVDSSDSCGCAYVGQAYSYYEFEQPIDDRLTDRQWRTELESTLVEHRRPEWIDSVLVSGTAPAKPLEPTAVDRKGNNLLVTYPLRHESYDVTKLNIDDQGLAKLSGLAPITRWLDLSGSQVTDSGVAELEALADLRAINLQGTKVTDSRTPRSRIPTLVTSRT